MVEQTAIVRRQSWKERIGLFAVGHSVKIAEEIVIDWLFYGWIVGYATYQYGAAIGSILSLAIMLPITAFLCRMYIVFYDWAKIDWLGLETLKDIRESASGEFISRIIIRIIRTGDIPAFILLSIWKDAFITTMYLRKVAHSYEGLSRRDWRIFWGSLVLSNVYWTVRWTIIIEAIWFMWAGLQRVHGVHF